MTPAEMLARATPEDLEALALQNENDAHDMAAIGMPAHHAERFRLLAALARAVAKAERQGVVMANFPDSHDTIPAALASLLTEDTDD